MQGRKVGPKTGFNRNGDPIGVHVQDVGFNKYGEEVKTYQWRFMYKGKIYSSYGYSDANAAMYDRTMKIKEVVHGVNT